jgi:hypothetical protein
MRTKPVEFKVPEEVSTQVGAAPEGTRLELMTSYAVKDDGRWCIVSIEGVPMPGYDAAGNPTGGKEEHMEAGEFQTKYNQARYGAT